MSATFAEVNLPGVGAIRIPASMVKQINPDGTLNCHRCAERLPLQTDPAVRAVGIIWNHQGIRCVMTETEMCR